MNTRFVYICLYILVFVNNASMNTGAQISLKYGLRFLWTYSRSGFLGNMVITFLIFWRCCNSQTKPLSLWSSNVLIAKRYFPFGEEGILMACYWPSRFSRVSSWLWNTKWLCYWDFPQQPSFYWKYLSIRSGDYSFNQLWYEVIYLDLESSKLNYKQLNKIFMLLTSFK